MSMKIKQIIKSTLLGLGFLFFVAAPVQAALISSPVSAADPQTADDCENRLFGAPPWFRGLVEVKTSNNIPQCVIVSPDAVGGLSAFIWKIVLNVIEIALVLVVYIAVFFILYGGFLFVTGGSNPSQTQKARTAILNAVIGLAIALGAIAITNLIFGLLG